MPLCTLLYTIENFYTFFALFLLVFFCSVPLFVSCSFMFSTAIESACCIDVYVFVWFCVCGIFNSVTQISIHGFLFVLCVRNFMSAKIDSKCVFK